MVKFARTFLATCLVFISMTNARPQINLGGLFGGGNGFGQQQQFQQQQFQQQQFQQQQPQFNSFNQQQQPQFNSFNQQQQFQQQQQFNQQQQHGNGLIQPGGLSNPNNLATAGAGIGVLGAGLFAVKNIAEGNDEISLAPTIGAGFNPHTGQIVPQVGVAAKVGQGQLAPTINLGGQFDGQNINPVVGGGVGVGNGGLLGGNVNTGFVFGPDGQVAPTVGGAATVGNFNVGRPFGGRGFGRR